MLKDAKMHFSNEAPMSYKADFKWSKKQKHKPNDFFRNALGSSGTTIGKNNIFCTYIW